MEASTARRIVTGFLILFLAACGGGGGGSSSSSSSSSSGGGVTPSPLLITFDTSSVEFTAAAPFDTIEMTKRVIGTVTGTASGTLYILVEIPANSFFTVPEVLVDSFTSGHATVAVPTPQTMGSGNFQGSFRVRACLNSSTCASGEVRGSPFTVNVRYTIGDVVNADTVTPRVVPSGIAGSVILRGHGFTTGSTVRFGATAAASVTYVSATELRATYPALTAGSYAVAINSGAVPFSGALVSVDTPAYPAAWIPHLSAPPLFPSALVYDAERRAFIYAANANNVMQIVRYEYSGGQWVQSALLNGEYVKQLRFTHDGTKLVGLKVEQYVATHLVEFDPVTLAVTRTTPVDGNAWTFALSNDGNYVLATRFPGSGGRLPPIMVGSVDRVQIPVNRALLDAPAVVASGDGSRVIVYGLYGDIGIYNSSAQTWTVVNSTKLRGSWDYATSGTANMNGTRFADGEVVFDQDLGIIGASAANAYLSSSTLNADGSRLYIYDQGPEGMGGPGRLRTFDVNAPVTPGTPYPRLQEIGAPIVFPNTPNGVSTTDYRMSMALTPDERTIFICGLAGCVVQPTPP